LRLPVDSRLVAVAGSVFIVMLGVGIVGPILPLYAESFRVSYSVVGLVVGAFGIARIFFDIPAGSLGDRFGRRPFVILGLFIFSATGLIAAFAGSIYDLILARFVQGMGAAFFTTPAMAYVGDIAPDGSRGRYVAYYQASFFLGVAVGPAIGGFLQELGGFRLPFIVLTALSALSGIFTVLVMKESLAMKERNGFSSRDFRNALHEMFSQRDLTIVVASNFFLFAISAGTRLTSIPLYAERVAGFNPAEIGTVISIIALFNLVILFKSGQMVDRIGGRPLLVYGFLLSAPVLVAFGFATDWLAYLALAAIYGVSTGLINPAQGGTIIQMADERHRGMFVGLFRVFGDLGLTVGPVLVGLLADAFGLTAPFVAVSFASLLMAGLASLMRRGGGGRRQQLSS
jgi:multidrug resistance protein